MNTCQAFQHPEAQGMCYAVKNGQLGDQKAAAELDAMTPAPAATKAPADKVEIGKPNPEAQQYEAASAELLAMAKASGKA